MNNLEIQVLCPPDLTDILIAELSDLDFAIFEETDNGFITYHSNEHYSINQLAFLIEKYQSLGSIVFKSQQIEKVNWNKEWESNYSPIEIEDKIYIRASFHPPKPHFETEILINPQMSFGTGHHETTQLVLQFLLEEDFKDKDLLDAGTGTGILAIFAKLRGARRVVGFDIDDWCVENAIQNAELNHLKEYEFFQGTIRSIQPANYSILIANINRNILLDEMAEYNQFLKDGGHLYLSGFYLEDMPVIQKSAENQELKFEKFLSLNQWVGMKFSKPIK